MIATILGSSMVFIDGSVVNVIMPELQREFSATGVEIQWVVESYLLFLASLILVGGSIGDHFGRKLIFQIGTVFFILASIGCGFSQTLLQMTIFRSLQGIGGALLTPGSLAIINSVFPRNERGRAIGTWSAFSSITTAFGPVLGGWLADNLSWRWVFFINVPLGLLTIFFTRSFVPTQCHETGREPLDLQGVVISTAGIASIVFGLIEANYLIMILGVILMVLFFLIERRTNNPLVPLSFFKSRIFSAVNMSTFLLYGALSIVFYFLPFNLIQVQGFSATEAGAANLPFVIIIFLFSRWSGGLYDRVGARLPIALGSLITGIGFLALGFMPGLNSSYWKDFLPGLILFGIGMSLCIAPLTTAVLGAVPERFSGLASGINNAVTRLAGLVGIAIMTAMIILWFHHYLDLALINMPLDSSLKSDLLRRSNELAGLQGNSQIVNGIIKSAYLESFKSVMISSALLSFGSSLCALVFLPSEKVIRLPLSPVR
ncbi:MFS transporter [Peredibacter sp. HCB2-198]|uniref:MFS transporter n=1 Tax=Peredibacter sp. HCB2-198 TaxID=3383025 RepID=UPI0038B69DE0